MRFVIKCIMLGLSLSAASVHAQKKRSATPNALGEDIYKHYTGTIGKDKVMVDLRYGYQGGSNYGGTLCYMPGQDAPIMLMIAEPASFDHGVPMTGSEYNGAADWLDRSAKHARWRFVIGDKTLTGTRYPADGKDSARISLVEDYTHSTPMDLVMFNDQLPSAEHAAMATSSQGHLVHIMTVLSCAPNAADATWVNSEVIKFVGIGNVGALTQDAWRRYPAADAKRHFANLTTSNLTGNTDARLIVLPLYNDKGILSLRRTEGDYGTEVITYLNLDTRGKRQWTFHDILAPDNEKLSTLLEAKIREAYSMKPEEKLTTLLNVDKVPVTQNIMVTGKGLYFTYRIGEIATKKQIDDDINLFISYSELKGMMQPGFKKRMDL